MKQKLAFTLTAILILNIGPLIFDASLIFHFKTILLSISAAVLWLSQPSFSKEEMQSDQNSDKYSILIILICSSLSVFLSVTEWAYLTIDKSDLNIVSFIGMAMLLIGIILRVWSINILGRHFTATVKVIDQHELIKTGPYKIVRHPSYLGALIAITGCPLFLNNFYTVFFCFFAMMIAYYFRINVEEKTLTLKFGLRYKQYQQNTYRLIPFIW